MKIIILISLFSLPLFSNIRNYSTTKMLSVGGAGVGSINMVDATSLNPATAAFYQGSLFYAQGKKAKGENSENDPEGFMVALTDTTNLSRGGFMFQKYSEQNVDRMRLGATMANPVSKNSAIGASYYYTIDKDLSGDKTKFHSANLGFSHIFSEKLSFGLVANNLYKADKRNSEGTLGFQLAISRQLALLIDGGFDYRKSFKKTKFYKLGAQVRFLKDFLLRGGYFHNELENTKGHSFGAGWVAPKMTVELGYQDTKALDKSQEVALLENDNLKEITASLIFKLK